MNVNIVLDGETLDKWASHSLMGTFYRKLEEADMEDSTDWSEFTLRLIFPKDSFARSIFVWSYVIEDVARLVARGVEVKTIIE